MAKESAVHFQKIGRESQFKSYFIKTIRQQIKLLWESKDDRNGVGNYCLYSHLNFCCLYLSYSAKRERINALYDTLLDRYQNEISFINAVFGAESGPRKTF